MNKEKKTKNTTEELAINFVKNAVNSIDKQLKAELIRCNFNLDDLRSGKTKLTRTVAKSETDERFFIESFSIGERLLMAVKWSPKGFEIEVNSEEVINSIKVNPNFGIKKNNPVNLILSATEREVEIEARAQAYLKTMSPK